MNLLRLNFYSQHRIENRGLRPMKSFVSALLVLLSGAAFAADTNRYVILPAAGVHSTRPVMQSIDSVDDSRFEMLEHVNVIVADLTDDEAAALRHDRSIRAIEKDRE